MAVRSSMNALIARVRLLINDTLPAGNGQVWIDQQIQDVMDESRQDIRNQALRPDATYSGSTLQYLDYYSHYGGWEDDLVLKQYLTQTVTPSLIEPIAGHFQFSSSLVPPVYISGKLYDVYRSAADLLERQAAQWALRYSMSVDGQSLQRGQVVDALQKLAQTYRKKQRVMPMTFVRLDIGSSGSGAPPALGATSIDYFASGNGS